MTDEYDPDELDRLELVAKGSELGLDHWRIAELSTDVPRALAIIAYAEGQRSLREPVGFILARFRAGFDPRSIATPLTPNEPEPERDVDEPPLPWATAHANWLAERNGGAMVHVAAMHRAASIRHGLEPFPPHVRAACELCAVDELMAAFVAHMENTRGDNWRKTFAGLAELESFERGLDRSFPWRVPS